MTKSTFIEYVEQPLIMMKRFVCDVKSCDTLIWMRTLKIGELPSPCLFGIRKMTAQHRTQYTALFVLICLGTVTVYSLGALAEGISEVHVYMQKNVQCASDGLLQFKLLKHVGFNTHLSDDPEVCMNVVCDKTIFNSLR